MRCACGVVRLRKVTAVLAQADIGLRDSQPRFGGLAVRVVNEWSEFDCRSRGLFEYVH